VEEALIFWRKSFSSTTDDKFNKDYKYNIRHGYGLEGKRMNYPPKSCVHFSPCTAEDLVLNVCPGPVASASS
jgi:DNA primase large subunit